MDYSQNGNCRYDVTFYQAQCTDSSATGTSDIFNDPAVIFEKEPFIADANDDRLVSMAGSDFFTIDVPTRKAANTTSLPDSTALCFQVTVTPQNSPLYTTTVTKYYHYSFLYCDPVFHAEEDPI